MHSFAELYWCELLQKLPPKLPFDTVVLASRVVRSQIGYGVISGADCSVCLSDFSMLWCTHSGTDRVVSTGCADPLYIIFVPLLHHACQGGGNMPGWRPQSTVGSPFGACQAAAAGWAFKGFPLFLLLHCCCLSMRSTGGLRHCIICRFGGHPGQCHTD
jgi:hypothetical protein